MPAQPVASVRRARTRDALVKAGLSLFAERPVDAVAIDQIVETAGVAKGSFFNHFRDKQDLADTIAADIRMAIEAMVDAHNAGVPDPLERLAGGMQVAARFALDSPQRTRVLLRGLSIVTARDHPLNAGLRSDIEAAYAAGLIRDEAREAGLLFWLGCCHMIISNIAERRFALAQAADRMGDMMLMGLTGLGVAPQTARTIAVRHREALLST